MTRSKVDLQRDLLLSLGAFFIALVLWQFRPVAPLVFPLRMFVTFIHELGHGVTAVVTGGEFLHFEVEPSGAGLAYSRGGFRPAVIAAGYVGTAIFGAVLLYAANRIRHPQHLSIGLGIAFTILTLFYTGLGLSNFSIVEILITFAVIGASGYLFLTTQTQQRRAYAAIGLIVGAVLLVYFAAGDNVLTVFTGVISGVALVLLGYYGNRNLNLFILNFLAFAVGLNAITDSWVLLKIVNTSRLVPSNDASSMATEVAFSATFWAVTWIGLAIVLLGISTWITFINPIRKAED